MFYCIVNFIIYYCITQIYTKKDFHPNIVLEFFKSECDNKCTILSYPSVDMIRSVANAITGRAVFLANGKLRMSSEKLCLEPVFLMTSCG